MFTGLVSGKAVVKQIRKSSGGAMKLEVSCEDQAFDVSVGDSVSVSGVCLTAVESGPERMVFDVVPNTLVKSTLPSLSPGVEVNIEQALKVGSRLDGHFVTGHIDGSRLVSRVSFSGESMELDISLKNGDRTYLIPRGSVAIDGVSLTVGELGESFLRVFIIPATASWTTLGKLKSGEFVNVEFDVMAKYAANTREEHGISFDTLRKTGFLEK